MVFQIQSHPFYQSLPVILGFDENCKIMYRNKSKETENGSVSFTFDAAVLDYVTSIPVYDTSGINNFNKNFIQCK